MKNISPFQIIVLAVFIFIAIVGVAIFAGFGGINQASTPRAVIWGTVPAFTVNEVVRNINLVSTVVEVTYVEKSRATFEDEFVNAIAEGSGPDAVLISDDMLYAQRNKLQPIPFSVLSERAYIDTFIDGAKIFIDEKGILGVPFSVDPLVMYYNRDIFANAGVAKAPTTWAEMGDMGPSIIQRTDTSTIIRALAPLGEYENVNNAKEIITTLLFQAGNPITVKNKSTNTVFSVLDNSGNKITSPAEAIINFYTSFADPLKQLYTWNRSLPNSRDAFLAGKLALYFGYSSELQKLQDKNPNLNFDVALMPKDPEGLSLTYGKITAFSIVKSTKNFNGTLAVISKMTDKKSAQVLEDITKLPSARRDILINRAPDAYLDVFNKATIQSATWYDPNPTKSNIIFKDMIESITSGRKKMGDAVTDARIQIDRLLKN